MVPAQLEERINRLEKANRRLRALALGATVLAGVSSLLALSAGLHAQARASGKTVEAERIVLRGGDGKMSAEIANLRGGPALRFFNTDGVVQTLVNGNGFFEFHVAGKLVESKHSLPRVSMTGTGLYFSDSEGNVVISLRGVEDPAKPRITPVLEIADAKGFRAKLGVTSLVTKKTGETHKTPAASLVLFGDDRTVLWSAP